MASVDLSDLIDSLTREVNAPGSNAFPDATDDIWLGHLRDAFWEAKLFGFFPDYVEADGLVHDAVDTTQTFDRKYQQLCVLVAALRIVRNELKNKNQVFRAQAGPVSIETQQGVNMLRDVLGDLKSKINLLVINLGNLLSTTTDYIDSLVDREDSVAFGETYFWRG